MILIKQDLDDVGVSLEFGDNCWQSPANTFDQRSIANIATTEPNDLRPFAILMVHEGKVFVLRHNHRSGLKRIGSDVAILGFRHIEIRYMFSAMPLSNQKVGARGS